MICPEHDLSVYAVNFQESSVGDDNQGKEMDNLIWEGHGLLSWVMEDREAKQVQIFGKVNQQNIDVYVELQPVSNANTYSEQKNISLPFIDGHDH